MSFNPIDCSACPSEGALNIGARIRQTEQRIRELSEKTAPQADRRSGECTMSEHANDNRLWLTRPSKPIENVRQALKRNGFKWTPTRGAWVRQVTDASRLAGETALAEKAA
jgi:hypothetical protein